MLVATGSPPSRTLLLYPGIAFSTRLNVAETMSMSIAQNHGRRTEILGRAQRASEQSTWGWFGRVATTGGNHGATLQRNVCK